MGDFPKVKKGQAVHRLNTETNEYDVGIIERAFDNGFILDLGKTKYMYSTSLWSEELEKLLLFETKNGKPVVNRKFNSFAPYLIGMIVGVFVGVVIL